MWMIFRKRYEELSLYEASDDEKKHVEHELHALSELINTIEPFKKHRFFRRPPDISLYFPH